MEPLPKIKGGVPRNHTNLYKEELLVMKEKASYMDKLYNCPNTYRGAQFHAHDPNRPWRHKNPVKHLRALGADKFWPMPEILSFTEAEKLTDEWREYVFDIWHELAHKCRQSVDLVIKTITDGENGWDDATLQGSVEEAWESMKAKEKLAPLFGLCTFPSRIDDSFWAWATVQKGFAPNENVPIPVYIFTPDGTEDNRFSKYHEFIDVWRAALQVPILNLHSLTNRKVLSKLVTFRGLIPPIRCVRTDADAMQTGKAGKLLLPPYADDCFMSFIHFEDPTEAERWDKENGASNDEILGRVQDYARVRQYTDAEARSSESEKVLRSGMLFGWGDGLLVLQAQAAILTFCLEIVDIALLGQDLTKSDLLPIHPFEPLELGTYDKPHRVFMEDFEKAVTRLNTEKNTCFEVPDVEDWGRLAVARWAKLLSDYDVPWYEHTEVQHRHLQAQCDLPLRMDHMAHVMAQIEEVSHRILQFVFTTPSTFRGFCKEMVRIHYGWVSTGPDGDDVLQHMVDKDIDAKRALANDVVRRLLRFCLMTAEMSWAVRTMASELAALISERGAEDRKKDDRGGPKSFPEYWSENICPTEGMLSYSFLEERYKTVVYYLRWFSELSATHVRAQGILHGSPDFQGYCRRAHVNVTTADTWALPKGLMREPRPPLVNAQNSSDFPVIDGEGRAIIQALQCVELSPPGDSYGVPGLAKTTRSIFEQYYFGLLFDQPDDLDAMGPTFHMICTTSIVPEIMNHWEIRNPFGRFREMFHDSKALEKLRKSTNSGKFVDELDDFDFESHFASTKDGKQVLADVHLLLGVRYANDSRTSVPVAKAKTILRKFRTSLEKWWTSKDLWPQSYYCIDFDESPTAEGGGRGGKSSKKSGNKKNRGKDNGNANENENGNENESQDFILQEFCGTIDTIDPSRPPIQQQPPSLADLKLQEPRDNSRPPKHIVEATLRLVAANRYDRDNRPKRGNGASRLELNRNHEVLMGGPRDDARDVLTKGDWNTLDNTLGPKDEKRSRMTWHSWTMMWRHMGFKVTPTDGSNHTFEWTPSSKLPRPTVVKFNCHNLHIPGHASQAAPPAKVGRWVEDATWKTGITYDQIQQCYNREQQAAEDDEEGGVRPAGIGGRAGGGEAFAVQIVNDGVPWSPSEQLWHDELLYSQRTGADSRERGQGKRHREDEDLEESQRVVKRIHLSN